MRPAATRRTRRTETLRVVLPAVRAPAHGCSLRACSACRVGIEEGGGVLVAGIVSGEEHAGPPEPEVDLFDAVAEGLGGGAGRGEVALRNAAGTGRSGGRRPRGSPGGGRGGAR